MRRKQLWLALVGRAAAARKIEAQHTMRQEKRPDFMQLVHQRGALDTGHPAQTDTTVQQPPTTNPDVVTEPGSVERNMPDFRWHICRLRLAPTRNLGQNSHALVVLNALLKSVKVGVDQNPERPRVKRAFRVLNRSMHRMALPAQRPFELEVLFFGGNDVDIATWLIDFSHYLQTNHRSGFLLVAAPEWMACSGAEITCSGDTTTPESIELEFLSPLPFHRNKGSARTALDAAALLDLFSKRIKSLFGIAVQLPRADSVHLRSNYWHYAEIHHASHSQPGSTQYYNGCVGSIYLTGNVGPLLPWLKLAEALHLSGNVALNPLGYFRLHVPARPLLDLQLQDIARWKTRIVALQEDSDDWLTLMIDRFGGPLDAPLVARQVLDLLAHPDWQPAPAISFTVPKRGGTRRLEKLPPVERLIHGMLHELLNEPIDKVLAPAAMGFRRGRSTQMALQQVQVLIQQGYRYVVESDIEDFFPSVDLNRLEHELDLLLPPGDLTIRKLLHKLLRAPWLDGERLHPRTHGLAQGSPLSPLLANLYLDRFDEVLSRGGGQLVRYADDFVILTRTRQEAEKLLELARSELAKVGLSLGEDKTAIVDIERGFRFLGQPFGGLAADHVAELFTTPSRKSVYITEPCAWLGHNGDALEIRHQGQPVVTIPLRRVSDIIVLDHANFSSGLVRKCSQHGVPLVFTMGSGHHVATLSAVSRRFYGIAERQALHYTNASATERLVLAKAFASQKIINYRPLLRSRYVRGTAKLLSELDAILDAIEMAPGVPEVRGHEGHAARLMFQTLNSFIKVPEFHFPKRLREKPDRMNSLFNFSYYLLFTRLNTLMRAVGLNPYLGFLHDGADDYETLVCDVQELFRSAVDRLLVSLVNLRIIAPGDFRETSQGMRLHPVAIRRLIERFEQMLHSDIGGLTLLRAMEAQVAALRNHVAEGKAMWYFRYPDSTLLFSTSSGADESRSDADGLSQTA